jgi:hypothetical protein
MKSVSVRLLSAVLVGVLLLLGTEGAFAGRGDKAGTSAAPELLIPVGARSIAMGNATASFAQGIDAIYWNPAGLARSSTSAEAMFSWMSYIADININYAAVSASFEGFGAVGLSMKAVGFGDIEITSEQAPDGTGQFFTPTYVTVGLTYSLLLTDRISVGITGNVISETIDRVSATGIGFNFGVQYSSFADVSGLSIGVAVKNIGPAMTFDGAGLYRTATAVDNLRPATLYKVEASSDELPSTIELAVGYQRVLAENHGLTLAGVFQNNNLADDQYKFGAEYAFANQLFLRAGYDYMPETLNDSRVYGATFGAGVKESFGDLSVGIDYAYRSVEYLDGNHVFTVTLGF